MKKLIAFVIFVAAGTATVMAQESAKIKFKAETIDYGKIEKGSDGVRVFEFTNIGNAPLVISNVTSSCGCTIPKKPEEPIKPGESGEIQVKYNTEIVGPIRRTVSVYSNAKEATKALKIKGRVVEKK